MKQLARGAGGAHIGACHQFHLPIRIVHFSLVNRMVAVAIEP